MHTPESSLKSRQCLVGVLGNSSSSEVLVGRVGVLCENFGLKMLGMVVEGLRERELGHAVIY